MTGTESSDSACAYCEGECVPWEALPSTDQGQGICDWCGRAITKEWPAVAYPDGDPSINHYHHCPYDVSKAWKQK